MKSAHTHTELNSERFDVVLGTDQTHVTPRTTISKKQPYISPFKYLAVVGDIGFAIVVPIVLAFVLGSRIDAERGTGGHTATFICVSVGIFIAVLSLRRRIKDIVG